MARSWTRVLANCSVQHMPERFLRSLIRFFAGALDWQSANRWPGSVTAFGCGCDRGSLANPFRVLRTGQAAPGNALTDALDDLADLAEQAGLVEDLKVSASGLPSAWNTLAAFQSFSNKCIRSRIKVTLSFWLLESEEHAPRQSRPSESCIAMDRGGPSLRPPPSSRRSYLLSELAHTRLFSGRWRGGAGVPGGSLKTLSLTWTRGILARLQAKCCVLECQQQHISGALYDRPWKGRLSFPLGHFWPGDPGRTPGYRKSLQR